MSSLNYQVQTIFNAYSGDKFYEQLKKAHADFFALTGSCDSHAPIYEERMNSFNDWYVFNHQLPSKRAVFVDYFDTNGIDSDVAKTFHDVQYSVYKVHKATRGKISLYDVLHDNRIKINEEDASVHLLSDDVFAGRTLQLDGRTVLLKGVTSFPKEVSTVLMKFGKEYRKKRLYANREKIVLLLERLRVRSFHYKHLNPSEIFDLSKFDLTAL